MHRFSTPCGDAVRVACPDLHDAREFTLTDGIFPGNVVLAQGTDGNLYGTTSENGPKRYGSFFGVTPGGVLAVPYGFDGSHGRAPFAGVILARDGNFYGTTQEGGANNGAPPRGTIFKITPGGALSWTADLPECPPSVHFRPFTCQGCSVELDGQAGSSYSKLSSLSLSASLSARL